jgi:predicted phage terminase large subunit-like protein
MTPDEIKKLKVAKVMCQTDLLFFISYFFKHNHKRKFVVSHHHKKICQALEKVLKGQTQRLIINIYPRAGKTEVAVKNFIAHALSIVPSAKFIHLSYSDDLALDNSESIKDMILSDAYQQMFPEVKIKKDSKAKKKWYTTEGGGVYATSASGQVTGFGAGKVDEEDKELSEFMDEMQLKEGFGGAIIIDDPIKPDDAESSIIRDKVNNKFDSTIRSRVNSRKTPIIIIMQRLHPNDLCGYLLKNDMDDWEVLSLPAIYEENGEQKALWPFKHTLEELFRIRGKTPQSISTFNRQYMQDPKPLEGLLYTKFMTYEDIEFPLGLIMAYVDTADTGTDYLCSIVYTEHKGLKYLLDVIYTQEAQEVTEKLVSDQFTEFRVNQAHIESNNGGRAFARNVERLCRDKKNFITTVSWFHQSKNKEARIKSNSSTVQNTVVYPSDWAIRWPEFYDSMTNYMAKGDNDHDDAQDTITGIVEKNRTFGISVR